MAATGTGRSGAAARAVVLASLLALLLGIGSASAQSSGLVIRNLIVQPNGETSVSISLPPGVTAADLDLDIRENGNVIEDPEVAETTVSEGGVLAEAALLLDTSGSLSEEDFAAASAAAIDFVTDVTGQGIPVTLIPFADDATVAVQASTDLGALTSAITALSTGGDTALNDAIVLAAGTLAQRPADRPRTIVLFTDGVDDGSTADNQQALGAASASQASIAAVALGDAPDTTALGALATGTNGSLLSVAESSQLAEALGDVAASITSQLTVTWTSDDVSSATVTVVVSVLVGDEILTDRLTVPNVRVGLTPQPPPPALVPTQPRLVGGTSALVLGLGAAAFGVGVFATTLLVPPASARSAKVLKRQLEGGQRVRSRRGAKEGDEEGAAFDEVRLKERLAAVMDAVPKPSGYDVALQSQLDQAAWPLRSGEFLALSIALTFAGLILGLAFGGEGRAILAATLAVVGGIAPRLSLIQRQQKRTKLFHEQLPDTLQMLAGSLRAGYGLMQGLENVSSEGTPPTATEFGRVLTETRLGVPLEDALGAMADRVGSDDFRWVTVAISIQRKVGGNLAELLDTVASTLRERDQVRRQVQVLSAEGKLSAIILVALPIVFALYLGATNPDYLRPLFATSVGRLMLVAAAVLLGLGITWIRSVIRIDV